MLYTVPEILNCNTTWFKKGNYGFSTKLDFFSVLHDMISLWAARDIKVGVSKPKGNVKEMHSLYF